MKLGSRFHSWALLGLGFSGLAQASSPLISSTPPTDVEVGKTYEYQVNATDPEGGELSYELFVLPAGMAISPTGLVSWTPTLEQVGAQTFKVIVRDPQGLTADQYADITVKDPINEAPLIQQNPPNAVQIGESLSYDLQATDADGDPLTYGLWSWPAISDLQLSDQGILSWTPASRDDAGEYWIGVTVDDGRSGVAQKQFPLTVIDATNQVPVINGIPQVETPINQAYTFDLQVSDGDGDELSYELITWPQNLGASVSAEGVLSWTPTRSHVGKNWLMVRVDDGHLGKTEKGYELQVIDPNNQAPVFTSEPITQATQGIEYQYPIAVSDADGDSVSLTLFKGPEGMILNPTTQTLVWTPTEAAPEGLEVKIDADDGFGGTARQRFLISVNAGNNTNNPPAASDQSLSLAEDSSATISLAAVDPEGQALSYSILSQPLSGSLSGTGAEQVYTPAANFYGTDSFTFIANDGELNSNLATVSITVTPVNDAPLANNLALETNEDSTLAIQLSGSDQENDPLTFTLAIQPANGSLSGTGPNLLPRPQQRILFSLQRRI